MAICLVNSVVGLALTSGVCLAIRAAMPSFPVVFSFNLVLVSISISVVTGVVSGFVTARGA